MNYDHCLEFLYSKLPMFSRIGTAALKNNLNNTLAICQFLGNPQQKFKTIHIAGTNGKGSVSHLLASIFQSAGYKTGLYTSPHLNDFRERIRINGEMIDKLAVIEFTSRIMPLIESIEPSFFEVTVGMAFDYFASESVDIAIIETGLGGRLDSTNVIFPEISIITNIGYDHTHILGNTLVEIAKEKSGIIKPGIPVVIGRSIAETDPVFNANAILQDAEIIYAEKTFESEIQELAPDCIRIKLTNKNTNAEEIFSCDLPGIYQKENITTVITAIEKLIINGWVIPNEAIKSGIKNVKQITGLLGRWDVLKSNPMVILDVAHNEEGIKKILNQIKLLKFNKLHFIIGFSSDKDISSILELLPRNAAYYFTKANIPRALDSSSLKKTAELNGLLGNTYPNVNTAIEEAIKIASQDDIILVCGSIFIVGEVDRERIINS